MAVAVKNSPTGTTTRPLNRLAVGSLLGVVYVLASIVLVFHGLGYLWWNQLGLDDASFPNWTGLILLMVGVAAGLFFLGRRLMGPSPPHGLRAGVFVGIMVVFLVGLLIQGIGITIENWVGTGSLVGKVVFLVITGGLAF